MYPFLEIIEFDAISQTQIGIWFKSVCDQCVRAVSGFENCGCEQTARLHKIAIVAKDDSWQNARGALVPFGVGQDVVLQVVGDRVEDDVKAEGE